MAVYFRKRFSYFLPRMKEWAVPISACLEQSLEGFRNKASHSESIDQFTNPTLYFGFLILSFVRVSAYRNQAYVSVKKHPQRRIEASYYLFALAQLIDSSQLSNCSSASSQKTPFCCHSQVNFDKLVSTTEA